MIIVIWAFIVLPQHGLGQNQIFTPINQDSCKNEVELIFSFNEAKYKFVNALNDSNYADAREILNTLSTNFNKSFLSQIYPEILRLGLVINDSELWKSATIDFIKSTMWSKEIVKSQLSQEKLDIYVNHVDVLQYIDANFDQIYASEILDRSNNQLIDQIFWAKAIWQRDQDYRMYHFSKKIESGAYRDTSALYYFDDLNLKSLKNFIENHGYPKFGMGTYTFCFVLLHMNKPEILDRKSFDDLNILMWNSVVKGQTKLSDYCYVVDRYLVNNLKIEPIYGLFYSDNPSVETINVCQKNRTRLGLRL